MKLLKKLFVAGLFASFSTLAFASAGAVNINKASAHTLEHSLKDISASQAHAIVAYRRKHGPFLNLSELLYVKGVGRAQIKPNYKDMKVGDVNGSMEKGPGSRGV